MADIKDSKNWGFETRQLHIGQEQADPVTDARAVPIYATTSYVFHDSRHAADRFGLRDAGNIYGRLTNPTEDIFEQRIASLEGGVAALAVASGAAAISYTFQALARSGEHIVAAKTIYGGQRQRVAIARMLLLDAPILVFDDSLSAVDSQTDSMIRKALGDHMKNATVILISHRITTLMGADRILVLNHGRIEEAGSHQELIQKDGIYRKIYDIQMNRDDRERLDAGFESDNGGASHGGL